MDSRRWDQVQSLFHAVCDLSPEEQSARLDREEDAQIRAQVLAMLEEDRKASQFLDKPVEEIAEAVLTADPAPLDRRIGPYRLERVLGEGGMGTVFYATRADLDSAAAIKILRDSWLSPARRERFRLEQRTLAQLDHPNIARFLDADTLESDGTPYIVMEYVDGVPIHDHCDQQGLSVPQRLQLFRAACEAVQFAHRHAIIHRDLKPSNILVKADGAVKLLDFGIAKRLADLEMHTGGEGHATRTELRLFTPAYASPEQMEGRPAGVQTDVYSLGVLLRQLLTGQLQPTGNRMDVPADLELLCLTAMHRDTAQRYSSCEALIRDLDHYVRGEPLEARPDSFGYRFQKFIQRHKRAVLGVTAACAAIAAGAVYFTVRLAEERNAALAEAARSQRLQRFMLDLFRGGDKEAGPSVDLRVTTLLDRGVLEAKVLDQDPSIQAELYQSLGYVYQQLGRLDQADVLLQSATESRKLLPSDLRGAAEGMVALGLLRTDQARLDEAEKLVRQGLTVANNLPAGHPMMAAATDALGRVLEEKGRYDEAITVLREAVRLRSASPAAKADLAASLYELANAYFYSGRYQESEELNKRVLGMYRQLYGDRHPRVAEALVNLGAIQQDLGHYPEAEQFHRRALDITRAFYGENHFRTGANLTMIARALVYQKRLDEAGELLGRALAIEEMVFGKVHPRVASALNEIGNIAVMQNRYEDAKRAFARMAAIYRETYGANHYLLATAFSNMGSAAMGGKDNAGAETLFRQAIEVFTRTLPAGHINTGIARIKLGRALLRQDRFQEAEVESRAGYDIVRSQVNPSVSHLNSARKDLASIYAALGQEEKAEAFRKEGAMLAAK